MLALSISSSVNDILILCSFDSEFQLGWSRRPEILLDRSSIARELLRDPPSNKKL